MHSLNLGKAKRFLLAYPVQQKIGKSLEILRGITEQVIYWYSQLWE